MDAVPAAEAVAPMDSPGLPDVGLAAEAAVPTDFLSLPDVALAAGAAGPTDFPGLPGADLAAEAAGPMDFPGLPDAGPAADSTGGAPGPSDLAHPPPTPYTRRFRPAVRLEAAHTIHHFPENAAVYWYLLDFLPFLHQKTLLGENFPPSLSPLLWT